MAKSIGKKAAAAKRGGTGRASARATGGSRRAGAKKETAVRKAAAKAVSKAGGGVRRVTAATGTVKRAGTSAKKARAATPVIPGTDAQGLAHGLHTLLHTMHTVQHFEETLCSLMHALQRGRMSAATMRELRAVLEQLPAQDYLYEVDALREAVAA